MLSGYAFLGDQRRSTGGSGGGVGGATGVVALSDHDINEPHNAFVEYRADGKVFSNAGQLSTWVTGSYVFGAYDIRATRMSGINPSGSPLSTWINLSGSESWALNATLLTKQCMLKVEIRRSSDGVVLDEAYILLSAEGEGGGDL